MQVRINTNDNQITGAGAQTQKNESERAGYKASQKQRTQTIFAGDLPIHKDPIVLRKRQAQKKAMKMIQDAWRGDRKMDQSVAQTREMADKERAEATLNYDIIQECEARKEKLRESYGVDPDSQEQQDLEFLEKVADTYGEGLTQEEEERLAKLQSQPLTEYQQKCLEINGEERIFRSRAENAQTAAQFYTQSVTDMKIERLKFHKMTDAQNNADKLMEETSKEIVGMLWEEAKDHVDETYEEQREEAKEEAEKKQEQEEKVEEIREEKEMMEERIESVREDSHEAEESRKEQERDARDEAELLKTMADAGMDVAGAGAAVKAEIKDMLHKMKLLEVDIKGIEVDEEI